jgi:undecaprenyl-diphosphatase
VGVASHDLSVLEAIGAALLQGVAIVYPISGLGHGVLIGSLKHGAGADLAPANAEYLYAALRIGVAIALVVHYWRDWLRIGRGLLGTVVRRVSSPPERRWAGLMVLAVVPGCVAVAFLAPHARPLLNHPQLAAACLTGNGVLMLVVWWWWRRSPRAGGMSGVHRARLTRGEQAEAFASELSSLRADRALVLGLLPLAALVPGVSGVALTVSVALVWGLTHEQSAHIALLLLTPMLLTWGISELPDLSAAEYDGVRTKTLLAGVIAAATAYLTAALLVRYFRRASLRPFGYYCVLAGGLSLIVLAA